jgi:hypothetical protein
MFSAVMRASGPVLMFCAPRLIFGGIEGVPSRFNVFHTRHVFGGTERVRYRFHVLRTRNRIRQCRVRRVLFFMFCAPGLVFGGIGGVGSRFDVLRSRSRFRRYQGRRVPFSCFARPDSFSAVPRASGPIFMFCAPGHVFGGTGGVGTRFLVLRAPTRFRGYRGCWVPFSCFAHP